MSRARRAARLLWRSLFGLRAGSEIERVRTALLRHEERVDEMDRCWARNHMPCCPSCAFGQDYSDVADQVERTRGWLVVLLLRRGRPEDLREADARILDGVPGHVRAFVERKN